MRAAARGICAAYRVHGDDSVMDHCQTSLSGNLVLDRTDKDCPEATNRARPFGTKRVVLHRAGLLTGECPWRYP